MSTALLRHAVLAACLLGSTAVLAQAAPQRPHPTQAGPGDSPTLRGMFNNLDANQDGKISREEATGGLQKLAQDFRRFDKNGDGFLSYAEFAAAMSEIPH